MFPNFPQNSFPFLPPAFLAGMPYDAEGNHNEFETWPASAAITPGQIVEIVSKQVRPAQAAHGALKPVLGVAVLKDTKVVGLQGFASGYAMSTFQVGEMVKVLTKGRVYANWYGTTQPEYGPVNYYHSTTGATASSGGISLQGCITDAAATGATGGEIDTFYDGISVEPTGNASVCLLNLLGPRGVTGP